MISNPTAAALFALGLFLTMGGIGLALFYGTLFYLVAGLLFMLTVYLLYHRQMPAPRLYAGFVLFALLWAVLEAGFDWGRLAPRGGVATLIGLWLLTPWIRRALLIRDPVSPGGTSSGGGETCAFSGAMIVITIAALYAFTIDPLSTKSRPSTETATASPPMSGHWADDGYQYKQTIDNPSLPLGTPEAERPEAGDETPQAVVDPAKADPPTRDDIHILDQTPEEPVLPAIEAPAPDSTIPEGFTALTQPISVLTFMPDR